MHNSIFHFAKRKAGSLVDEFPVYSDNELRLPKGKEMMSNSLQNNFIFSKSENKIFENGLLEQRNILLFHIGKVI